MKKILLLLLYASMTLFAYVDADLDGVDDSVDKCPNTPFMELVDIDGCTKKVLVPKYKKHHFDIIVGANFSTSDYASLSQTDTLSTSLQLDYYYDNFSLQLSGSYYKMQSDLYSNEGFNDSFVGVAYSLKKEGLVMRFGLGALLPTYDAALNNNKTDYSASLNVSYAIKNFNIFGGTIYTKIEDEDVILQDSSGNTYSYIYQDTVALSGGAGYYFTKSLYGSLSYSRSQSVYSNLEDIETLSLYGYKSIDQNWFVTLFYAYGLSESASDHALSVKLGYYF